MTGSFVRRFFFNSSLACPCLALLPLPMAVAAEEELLLDLASRGLLESTEERALALASMMLFVCEDGISRMLFDGKLKELD